MNLKWGNFDFKKAVSKIAVGALSTLIALGAGSPNFFERVFLPESIALAFGVGGVLELLDFILNRITTK